MYMLNVQYRIHPQICDILSTITYEKRLCTDDSKVRAERLKASGQQAVTWISYPLVGNQESKSDGGSLSWVNEHEVKMIVIRPAQIRRTTATEEESSYHHFLL